MLLTLLLVLATLLVFYAYLVTVRKTDETMLGTSVVMAALLTVAFTDTPSLTTLGAALVVCGLFVVVTTRRIML